MSTEVTIAIITAVASLLVAVVSLVNSIISNRQSAHSAKMIEALRFEFEDKKSTQTMSDEYLVKSLESLDTLIQAIQRMKDIVHLIVNATDSSLDSESAIDSTSEARLHLFACYEEELPNLKPAEAKGAHRAKNQALAVEMQLRSYLQGTDYVSELSGKQRRTLTELRNDLTDAQNLLRDSRANRLAKRIQSI